MELIKADKKHIQEEASRVIDRIRAEATEYATLYEKTYYATLIETLQAKIEAVEAYEDYMKKR